MPPRTMWKPHTYQLIADWLGLIEKARGDSCHSGHVDFSLPPGRIRFDARIRHPSIHLQFQHSGDEKVIPRGDAAPQNAEIPPPPADVHCIQFVQEGYWGHFVRCSWASVQAPRAPHESPWEPHPGYPWIGHGTSWAIHLYPMGAHGRPIGVPMDAHGSPWTHGRLWETHGRPTDAHVSSGEPRGYQFVPVDADGRSRKTHGCP